MEHPEVAAQHPLLFLALTVLLAPPHTWTGTAQDLLRSLQHFEPQISRSAEYPQTPEELIQQLQATDDAFRAASIELTISGKNVTLTFVRPPE